MLLPKNSRRVFTTIYSKNADLFPRSESDLSLGLYRLFHCLQKTISTNEQFLNVKALAIFF